MTYDTINDAVTIAGGEGTLLANRYRIVRRLGQGGMGSVWLAEDTQLDDKPFAIKMLPSILVSNKRAYRQLKDEALVAMKLTHPNIVTLRAFEENNGNPFLVMDYVDGQTLDDYLADYFSRVEHVERVEGGNSRGTRPACPSGGLPEADVLRILHPIAAALDYAHTKGVVHRDVKPANVMIAKDGTPYILDFGIAREIQETMTRVTGKFSSGTLLYMSPEQLHGASPKPAQDVYSFATMVYECLKGEPPFIRGQIEYQIDNDAPKPLPGGTRFSTFVMRGLAKRPENRPPTCTAVLYGNTSHRVTEPQSDVVGRVVTNVLHPIGSCFPSMPLEELNGHKMIQLWKDGPYWADTNIGAEKPWEYGYYFWWGDTVGYKRENGIWVASDGSASRFSFKENIVSSYNKSSSSMQGKGRIAMDNGLALERDSAHVKWGGGWRMPTKKELDELNNKGDWTWTTMNGVKGYVVRGRGDYASASIFLPCAGYGYMSLLYYVGSDGFYWSSGPHVDFHYSGYLRFYSGNHYNYSSHRYLGFPVRPVKGFVE